MLLKTYRSSAFLSSPFRVEFLVQFLSTFIHFNYTILLVKIQDFLTILNKIVSFQYSIIYYTSINFKEVHENEQTENRIKNY